MADSKHAIVVSGWSAVTCGSDGVTHAPAGCFPTGGKQAHKERHPHQCNQKRGDLVKHALGLRVVPDVCRKREGWWQCAGGGAKGERPRLGTYLYKLTTL